MSMFVTAADGWDFNAAAERRYNRLRAFILALFLIAAIVIPFLQLVGVQEGGGKNEETYVNVLQDAELADKAEEPKPAEEEEKPKPEPEQPKTKPQEKEPAPKTEAPPKPEPTQEQLEANAREVAKKSGINALADQLADLKDNSISGLDAQRPLSDQVIVARSGAGGGGAGIANIAQSAASGSGGIGSASANTPRTQSGAGLGQRRTTVVEAPKGLGPDMTKPGQSGDKRLAGRTLEEIQEVFDRNKASFYSMYNRALRESPDLRGKIVVSLTIAPDGRVTDCQLVSSELGDPDLERKVVQRVLLLQFKPKDVPAFTYPNYPIVFLPS